MRRSDWLLLFLAEGSGRPLAPVRLQKGLFLLAMSETVPRADRYAYEAYSYGPMSRELYRDVRDLCAQDLAAYGEVEGSGWRTVAPTTAGRRRARRLRAAARKECAAGLVELMTVRARVESLSFADLLTLVYDAHPEYTVRSVFRRP
jgi:uncharacterized protein YwgA